MAKGKNSFVLTVFIVLLVYLFVWSLVKTFIVKRLGLRLLLPLFLNPPPPPEVESISGPGHWPQTPSTPTLLSDFSNTNLAGSLPWDCGRPAPPREGELTVKTRYQQGLSPKTEPTSRPWYRGLM